MVTSVYVNPQSDQFWIIDYRICDPDGDGKSMLEHMKDHLLNCVYQKNFPGGVIGRHVVADSLLSKS